MPLTDIAIRKANPREKKYRLADGRGLSLVVIPKGGKYWIFRYRFAGKPKELSLGAYPDVGLLMARERCLEARKCLVAKEDPAVRHAISQMKSGIDASNSFETIARDWLANHNKSITPRYAGMMQRRMERDIFPHIGGIPIGSITPPVILSALKKVQERGVFETTHRLKQYCSMVFRHAVAHGIIERDPTTDLRGALIPTARKKHHSTISASDIPDFLEKLSDSELKIGIQTRLTIRLILLTFVRTTELIRAKWSEIDFDTARWIIPAERMKMRRDHIVPLSRQALEILATLRQIGGREYVFRGGNNPRNPMSNGAILAALRRMGYGGKMTGHGFRALAMTTLREQLDYPKDYIDLQLAHSPKDKVSAAYDRAKFLPQRTEMMQRWADYIDTLSPPL